MTGDRPLNTEELLKGGKERFAVRAVMDGDGTPPSLHDMAIIELAGNQEVLRKIIIDLAAKQRILEKKVLGLQEEVI